MRIYLGLGTNLGDRWQNLEKARQLLSLNIVQTSSIYETEPVDYISQPWFFNQVLEIEAEVEPFRLLHLCQDVENQMLRRRDIAKGPRTIDVDILFMENLILRFPDLVIPHPAIAHRRFVLVPMQEIAADFIHPVHQKTIAELLQVCPDPSTVRRL